MISQGKFKLFTIIPAVQATPDYSAGDVLFAPTEIPRLFTDNRVSCVLRSIMIIDKQVVATHAFTLYFTYSSTALGDINATAGVAIGTLEEIQATVPIADADWIAGGGAGSVDNANICNLTNPAVDGIGSVLSAYNWAGSGKSTGIHVVGIANETMNVASTSDFIIKIGVEY
tara:strand:+ start:692 stop:1207 length:516 start_codon:yes stop_codon:yes gene_type:complete